ncbi:hypothetical protein [Agaribacterium haliotis]|uniref:hypothetical protein n=1 Tax=Agaribacterium haliotis TaxID=2013869 RepID=UPI000BB54DF3|nr:hypothetical protein [Agaribacterium haliotis]
MKYLAFLWLLLWSLPCLGLVFGLILFIPVAILSGVGVFASVPGQLLALMFSLALMLLWLRLLWGWFTGFYYSWLLALVSSYLSVFVLGVTLAAGIFNFPLTVSSAVLIVLIFAAALVGRTLQLWLQGGDVRERYSVEQRLLVSSSP